MWQWSDDKLYIEDRIVGVFLFFFFLVSQTLLSLLCFSVRICKIKKTQLFTGVFCFCFFFHFAFYFWLVVTQNLKDLQGAGHNISAATIIQLRVSILLKLIFTPAPFSQYVRF